MNLYPGSAVAVERALGDIEFRNVDFQYPLALRMALQDISFMIPHGTRVGILGRDGAGQHTLTRLITGSCQPTRGQAQLDGIDICRYSPSSFERQFSIIDQEPQMLAASVAENIALDRPNAGREDVIEAARRAGIHEFISTLLLGYETPIGESGVRLPRVRRQQMAIARALLKDPAFVIYEELADTALDLGLEQGIEALAVGRTFLTIAHRIATLERCDLVLVLNEGRLTVVPGRPSARRPHLVRLLSRADHFAV